LYSHGFGENELSKILSVGVLGLKHKRKLVPTRWSITATDDTLGKEIIKSIRSYRSAEYQLFHGSLYGNYYFIMVFPDVWSYELFEGYLPRSLWSTSEEIEFVTDYESFSGRKDYAENTAGGYYAARLPILEKLHSMRKQASVIAIRFVTDEYTCPLGVFVCREAVRKSMGCHPVKFSSRDEMLAYTRNLIIGRFNYDISHVLSRSILLSSLMSQSKLSSWSPEPESD